MASSVLLLAVRMQGLVSGHAMGRAVQYACRVESVHGVTSLVTSYSTRVVSARLLPAGGQHAATCVVPEGTVLLVGGLFVYIRTGRWCAAWCASLAAVRMWALTGCQQAVWCAGFMLQGRVG
jgi:hypothetical protein